MAQWAGRSTGRTQDGRVVEAENSLRLAISALRSTDEGHRPAKAKNVRALAEAVLSARVRRLKAVLNKSSEQRMTGHEKHTPAEVSAQRRNLEELLRSGVESVFEEFGVATSELEPEVRSNNSLERTREG
jgi:hypothetical protein